MSKYDESSIKILEGLEAVRKRPAMYIGTTDKRGLHHLVWEIVDNAVDEVINGHGNEIDIILNENGSITIKDSGRGMPAGMHASGVSTPEVIFTVLHAGGKFEEGGYKVSGGLHGVGAAVVNALSSRLEATIYDGKNEYFISFRDGGHVDVPLKKLGKSSKRGTTVTFMPDKNIFTNNKFSYTTICERMQESAFLIDDLTINIKDMETEKEESYFYKDGLKAFVEYLNDDKTPVNPVHTFKKEVGGIEVSCALQYTNTYSENVISFVNNVKTNDGGTHEIGFKSAVTRVFNEYARNFDYLKTKDKNLEGSDTREGLTAIISLKIPENLLQFEGQTKSKLGTPEARGITESITSEELKFYLEENNKIASNILDKMIKSKSVREAAKKAREAARGGKDSNKTAKLLSGKLMRATKNNKAKNELFLVEGDSAGGSAKLGRDRTYQAILPLRGKVINAEKITLEALLKNEEINTIIHTIGAGVGSDFNPDDSNYNKVIIMTDADDDGAHIQILLLTFFYRYMKPLIEVGKLYVANPPLYKLHNKKEVHYGWTDEDYAEIMNNTKTKLNVTRFKGLGEMDPEELRKTTMDETERILIKVDITDAALAEKRVSVLMGTKVEPRKDWIEENINFDLVDKFEI